MNEKKFDLDELCLIRYNFANSLNYLAKCLLDEDLVNKAFLEEEREVLKKLFSKDELDFLLYLSNNVYFTLGNCD